MKFYFFPNSVLFFSKLLLGFFVVVFFPSLVFLDSIFFLFYFSRLFQWLNEK